MVDSTNRHTIVLENLYFVDVRIDAKERTVQAEMYTAISPKIMVYSEKFYGNEPVDYVKATVIECTKLIPRYNKIVGLDTKD